MLLDVLKQYKMEAIKIAGKEYQLFSVNAYDSILYAEVKNKRELKNILRFRPLASKYSIRAGIIKYGELVLVKNYGKNRTVRILGKVNEIDQLAKTLLSFIETSSTKITA